MKVERFIKGSGITERTVERKTAESHEDMSQLMAEHWPTYQEYLSRLEQQAVAYLQKKELPHALKLMDIGNGWEESRPGKNRSGPIRQMILPKVMAELGWAEDSWPGYAARIIWQVHRIKVETAAHKKDVWRIADFAHRLGELVSQSGFKRTWEKPALRGKKQRDALSQRRDVYNASTQAARKRAWNEWQAVAERVWATPRNALLSKNAVALKVKAELALPDAVDTIARRLQKTTEA
jgi:hypothetical protein